MKIVCLMENAAGDAHCAAEHGLSLYIEVGGRKILFDAGQTEAFADNAALLGVDLAQVDTCILSHGHYDHSGGLLRFLALNNRAKIYMHRLAPEPHYNGTTKYIGIDPAILNTGRVVFTDDALDLGDGLSLCTCNARIGDIPASAKGMTVRHGDDFAQDPFAHEQYLIIEENGRRIAVSGCSHKGILSIMDWLSPDVLVGGLHLVKLDPEGTDRALMEQIAIRLAAHGCTYYTGHCTGEAAFAFLKARMGEAMQPLHAGTIISL